MQPTPNLCTLEMMDKNGTEKSVMRVWESAFLGSPIKSIAMTNRMKLEEGFQLKRAAQGTFRRKRSLRQRKIEVDLSTTKLTDRLLLSSKQENNFT